MKIRIGSRLYRDYAHYLDCRRDELCDCLGAIRCMVDMVGEDSDHELYSPFTGEYLQGDGAAFIDALKVANPPEIVSEVAKWHYGLSH